MPKNNSRIDLSGLLFWLLLLTQLHQLLLLLYSYYTCVCVRPFYVSDSINFSKQIDIMKSVGSSDRVRVQRMIDEPIIRQIRANNTDKLMWEH